MTDAPRTRLSTSLAAFIIATIVLYLGTPSAQACSCLAPDPGRDLGFSNAAFVGELVDVAPIRESEFGTVNAFTFAVIEWVKADLGKAVTVTSTGDGASCGLVAKPGDIMGILTSPGDTGQLSTGLCQIMDPDVLLAATDESDPETSIPAVTNEQLNGPLAESPPGVPPPFEESGVPQVAVPEQPRTSDAPRTTSGISPALVIGGLLGLGGTSLYVLDRRRKIADDKNIW